MYQTVLSKQSAIIVAKSCNFTTNKNQHNASLAKLSTVVRSVNKSFYRLSFPNNRVNATNVFSIRFNLFTSRCTCSLKAELQF